MAIETLSKPTVHRSVNQVPEMHQRPSGSGLGSLDNGTFIRPDHRSTVQGGDQYRDPYAGLFEDHAADGRSGWGGVGAAPDF